MKNHNYREFDSSARYFCFQGNNLLVPADTPDSGIEEAVESGKAEVLFENSDVFTIPPLCGKEDISALMLNGDEAPSGWRQIPMRQAVNSITSGTIAEGAGDLGRLFRAFHVGQWRKESRFCGSCGSPNIEAQSGELARQCSVCGRLEFPRICPAVITIITNDKDEALLAHNKKFNSGIYSLIAGFNEAGENLEATVEREIREEVRIDVKDICYVKSQPWPFPNSLMLGFKARYAGGTVQADGIEIEDAQWFSRDRLPNLPGNGSVSRYLITLWLEHRL